MRRATNVPGEKGDGRQGRADVELHRRDRPERDEQPAGVENAGEYGYDHQDSEKQ